MPAKSSPSSMPVRRKEPPSIRTGAFGTHPWVPASGSAIVREGKAVYYLTKAFDHQEFRDYDQPVEILAKVVCNLRNYHGQDQDTTVRLVLKHFNPKSDYQWSEEGIRLTWELVEPFTPSLGLADRKASAKQQAELLENEVVDLIAWTVPGGRVLDQDLLKVFKEWNPEIEVTLNAFTRAVNAITGLQKKGSNGKSYWVGFQLPTTVELKPPQGIAA